MVDAVSRPHEEEWSTGEGALAGALYSGETWIGSFTKPERARLAVQAPKLARMLLEHLQACDACKGDGIQWVRASAAERVAVECTGCSDDRAVLRAAGVIP